MVEGLLLRVYKACFGGGKEDFGFIIYSDALPIRFQFYLLSLIMSQIKAFVYLFFMTTESIIQDMLRWYLI